MSTKKKTTRTRDARASKAPTARRSAPTNQKAGDWTVGFDGRSNSSPDYLAIVKGVEARLRDLRVGDDPNAAARGIVSGLAFGPYAFTPTRDQR